MATELQATTSIAAFKRQSLKPTPSQTHHDAHPLTNENAKKQKERDKQKLLENAGELRKVLYEYIDSKTFTGLILGVIFLNTAILVIQTFAAIQVAAGWYFAALDSGFLGIYIMEIVLKIYVWRRDFFKCGWNLMDFTIVFFNVIDFLLPLVMQTMVDFDGAAIFRLLRIFRAVRAIRALRVLRTIRLLSNLQVLMNTLLQSIQSMGAIAMLMLLFVYMFAVIGKGLYGEVTKDRFGNLWSASYTLFQLLTLDDWFDIYNEAAEQGNWHIFFFLTLYIFLEYFIFLNLFVAVLVDNFQLSLRDQNEESERKKHIKKRKIEEEDRVDEHLTKIYTGEDPIVTNPQITDENADDDDNDDDDDDGNPDEEDEIEERNRKPVTLHDFFDEDHIASLSPEDAKDLESIFMIMTSLEYNTFWLNTEQSVLHRIVDICVETTDEQT